MSSLDRIVDTIIQKAMEDGEFDHLPGYGKPIEWKDNPFTPDDWRMVEDLLRKNHFSYPWMEKRKEIEDLIQELSDNTRDQLPMNAFKERQITEQIKVINKKIFDYNLSVPVMRLQRRIISLEDLLKSIHQE